LEKDYKQEYTLLSNCVEDALDCLPEEPETFGARWILKMALQQSKRMATAGCKWIVNSCYCGPDRRKQSQNTFGMNGGKRPPEAQAKTHKDTLNRENL
jgi:hypothetical protein